MANVNTLFQLTLFGSFQARINGEPMPRTRTVKGLHLLAYLTLKEEPAVKRGDIALDLWPNSEGNFLNNLSQELYFLRIALGKQAERLQAPSRDTLRLDLDDMLQREWQHNPIDVIAFDRAIAEGSVSALTAAVSLYQGPLLAGWNAAWINSERARRQENFVAALRELTNHAAQNGDYVSAGDFLRRVAAVGKPDENDWRELLTAAIRANDPHIADQIFIEMRALFGELSPAAMKAAQQIPRAKLRRELDERDRHLRRATQQRRGLPCLMGVPFGVKQRWKVCCPIAATSAACADRHGRYRQTHLASHLAHHEAEWYKHGAWFVSLADIQEGALIAPQIASALKIQTNGKQSVRAALRDFLRANHLLLVLDNCEHLLEDCAALLTDLLKACPGLHIVATSRETLPNAYCHELSPLAMPDAFVSNLSNAWRDCEAMQLLLARVGNATGYAFTPQHAPVLTEICRRLEGVPLAIELAAAQAFMRSPAVMLAALNERLAFLASERTDIHPRHRSVRAALQWSYGLLHPEAQAVFAQCSVFRSGWTRESAQAVCKLPPVADEILALNRALKDLRSVSLIRVEDADGDTRFAMLETMREFGREKLSAEDSRELSHRHAEHVRGMDGSRDAEVARFGTKRLAGSL